MESIRIWVAEMAKQGYLEARKKPVPGLRLTAKALGKEGLKSILKEMLLIRHFELRAESAYQQGKVGGFFHAYMGQEAIVTFWETCNE